MSLRSAAKAPAMRPPLPLFTNLLGHGSAAPFGNEGRCVVGPEGLKLRLRCLPGKSVAGMTLAFDDFRLPAGAPLQLRVSAKGSGLFKAQVTARGADADTPLPVASNGTTLPLPVLGDDAQAQLVIIAPAQGGDLLLENLELVSNAPPQRPLELAAWAWAPEIWRTAPEELIVSAKTRGIKRLFVSLEVDGEHLRHRRELGRFVRLAGGAGIAVEGVEGDPNMVVPAGLQASLSRARAFARYQQQAPLAERLAGLQYDVEPYILPGWGLDPVSYTGWGDAILQLAQAAGEPIDLVLPFWIAGEEGGRDFLRRITPVVRGLTIMSYRTEAPLLSQVAEPLLAWGAREGKPVRLALEAGALADETEQVYEPSPSGTFAILPGAEPRVLLLNSAGAIPGAAMYTPRSQTVIPATRISFLGNEQAMAALAARVSETFSAWSTFSGFAFHGLDWR